MTLSDRFWVFRHTLKEKMQIQAAWMLPKWLVYWCGIRLWVNATGGKWSNETIPEMTFDKALERWRAPDDGSAPQS